MDRQYNVIEHELGITIWYEEGGIRYSFTNDLANSDYQAYLEHLTENPTEDVE